MLSDFFRINLPYGLVRDDESSRWRAFNREYQPIGFSEGDYKNTPETLPIRHRYFGLTDKFIQELTGYDTANVERDAKGNICRFWLYNDSTNPMNQPEIENGFWDEYWQKLRKLAELKTLNI